jgi:Single-strand binding protein family
MHVNVVHLIGYLGKNPEHKSVKASDRKYAVLSLATQRTWKGAGEELLSSTSGIASSPGTASASTRRRSCGKAPPCARKAPQTMNPCVLHTCTMLRRSSAPTLCFIL